MYHIVMVERIFEVYLMTPRSLRVGPSLFNCVDAAGGVDQNSPSCREPHKRARSQTLAGDLDKLFDFFLPKASACRCRADVF